MISAKEAYEMAKNFKNIQTKRELDKILALIEKSAKVYGFYRMYLGEEVDHVKLNEINIQKLKQLGYDVSYDEDTALFCIDWSKPEEIKE